MKTERAKCEWGMHTTAHSGKRRSDLTKTNRMLSQTKHGGKKGKSQRQAKGRSAKQNEQCEPKY